MLICLLVFYYAYSVFYDIGIGMLLMSPSEKEFRLKENSTLFYCLKCLQNQMV